MLTHLPEILKTSNVMDSQKLPRFVLCVISHPWSMLRNHTGWICKKHMHTYKHIHIIKVYCAICIFLVPCSSHTFGQNTLLFSSTNNIAGNLSNTWIPKETFHGKIICPERHKAIPTITIFALACWPFLHYELWQQTDYSSQVVSKVPWIKKIANYKQSENYLTSKSLTLENSNEKKIMKKSRFP